MQILWVILKLYLTIAFCYSLLHAFISHLFLWVEMRLTTFAEGKKENDISFFILLKSFCIEAFLIFIRCLWFPFSRIITLKPNLEKGLNTYPILLLPGYLQTQLDWLWFRHKFHQEGFRSIYTLNLTPPTDSITNLAKLVKTKVEEIKSETGQSKVIIIGHSMGGLVASYFAENYATPEQIVGIITLGAPFHGSRLSAFGYGKNVPEMAPYSPFSKQLSEQVMQSSISYYHIATKIDNMVVPWQSALPSLEENRKNDYIINDLGHLALIHSSRIFSKVCEWIKNL